MKPIQYFQNKLIYLKKTQTPTERYLYGEF